MNKRLLFTAGLVLGMSFGFAQAPGEWTEVIGPAQGWANLPPVIPDLRTVRSARPIHIVYCRPTTTDFR
ncbi:MAG: hypothetical protein M3R13_11395 [Armatimonadota bacterium]|nr:hypothetical protein [Armatimonadota bacterium]